MPRTARDQSATETLSSTHVVCAASLIFIKSYWHELRDHQEYSKKIAMKTGTHTQVPVPMTMIPYSTTVTPNFVCIEFLRGTFLNEIERPFNTIKNPHDSSRTVRIYDAN